MIHQGRKLNKILCLGLLGAAVLFLTAAAVRAFLDQESRAYADMVLALITGGFGLFYGMLWAFWARKERKAADALRELAAKTAAEPDPGRPDSEEFTLPKDRLTEAARKRFLDVVKWSRIGALVVFAVIFAILLFNDALTGGIQQPVSLALFSVLLSLPAVVIQWIIYKRYESSVPGRVLLYPGKLVVDAAVYSARDIREIRVSSARRANPNSVDLYREMEVRAAEGSRIWRIDYRAGDGALSWEAYPWFVRSLTVWGKQNGVSVTVDYMD